jgi:hypothetical protein
MIKDAKNPVVSRLLAWIAITAIAGLLQGCVPFQIGGYGPDGQSRLEFERRVEAVFRLQNKMTSEVMVLQEGEGVAKDQEAILQAEQVMQKNCSYLNEYASRDNDGLNKSLLLKRRVKNSVFDCEAAAHRVEALLKAYINDTTPHY